MTWDLESENRKLTALEKEKGMIKEQYDEQVRKKEIDVQMKDSKIDSLEAQIRGKDELLNVSESEKQKSNVKYEKEKEIKDKFESIVAKYRIFATKV
jgi:predicted  nucleic acid-binding Zn-ribbon protein